jgi:uncharacterized protein DUF955
MTEEALIASALREQLELAPRVDLHSLCRELQLEIVEVSSGSFDGALLRSASGRAGRILVKQSIREQGRKRFTIAHEIGHFLLHVEERQSCSSADIESWKYQEVNPERQADSFASELLLPSAAAGQRVGNKWPSFEVIADLAEHFESSLTAAARKFCDVATQSCAVVWSEGGKIRWMHRSGRFAYWIPVGSNLGYDSLAARTFQNKSIPATMEEVPAEAWIDSSRLIDDAIISEQTIAMPSYGACLTLLWARRELENRASEADELLSELDPEGFTLNRKRWPR